MPEKAPEEHRRALLRIVDATPGLAETSGAALMTGLRHLRPNALVCIGLNPGGEAQGHGACTIRRQLEQIEPEHNAYLHERWGTAKRTYACGASPHQRRVRRMVGALGFTMASIFGANVIPVRSGSAADIAVDIEGLFARAGWPLLDYYLSEIRPRLILCLGNGLRASPWSLLLGSSRVSLCGGPRDINGRSFRDGRICRATITLSAGTSLPATILAAPHPSRFEPSEGFLDFSMGRSWSD